MARLLRKLFEKNKGNTLLGIFPHADDESFVSAGLLRMASNYGVKVKIIALTNGKPDDSKSRLPVEFKKAVKILGAHESEIWDYKEGNLSDHEVEVISKLESEISKTKPFAVVTFDPNGITGHTDHIFTSVMVLNLLKKMKDRPQLLWRISDKSEKEYFYHERPHLVEKIPTYTLNLSLKESVNKLRAIFTYDSQFTSLSFRLRILEWYLFDHKEGYYNVEFDKDKLNVLFHGK